MSKDLEVSPDAIKDSHLVDDEKSAKPDAESLPYGDSKRSHEFSAENFKLEIGNLPEKPAYHLVRHLVQDQLKVNTRKIRLGNRRAYLAFRSAEDRDAAILKINNFVWKDRTLSAKPASPRYDPFAKKPRRDDSYDDEHDQNQQDESKGEVDINLQVCPLFNKEYEHQLCYKSTSIKAILNIGKQLRKMCPSLHKDCPALFEWTQKNPKISCKFDGVVPSPLLSGYRNKCEFNVGCNGTVGFKSGRYKEGHENVYEPPLDCPIVSNLMFPILKIVQSHLKDAQGTKLRGFNNVTHEGHVRQLTIRSNKNGQILVIIDMHPQELTEEEVQSEIDSIVTQLKTNDNIVSIFFNVSERNHLSGCEETMKLVYGQDHLDEYLEVEPGSPLKFRIGPTSFFQINTKAAEILYRSIVEMAELGPNSLVLDVGCGTGTIGLSLAQKVSYIIGIEIVKAAVEDAKLNAQENKIKNVLFLTGKAEDLIGESISILKTKLREQNGEGEIVAIVDPPRVGFNNSFIKSLRASGIKKIIYIACDPKANTNLVSLCRPPSKAYQGDPFVPVRAKAFDLFPHTRFCELLVVYERLPLNSEK